MKKFLAVLMTVALLASLSAMAIAVDSPSQDVPAEGAPTKEPAIAAVEIVAADEIETEEDVDFRITDEDLPNAEEEVQEAVNAVIEQKDDAVDALTPENVSKALPADVLKEADGKTAVCTDPEIVWSFSNTYPCAVFYTLDHMIDCVLVYDGEWAVADDLEIVENEDGGCDVSFVIQGPVFFTNVIFK